VSFGGEDEETLVSDHAVKLSERIALKTGLKQVIVSLNINVEAVQMMGVDVKMGMMMEKRVCDVIKQKM